MQGELTGSRPALASAHGTGLAAVPHETTRNLFHMFNATYLWILSRRPRTKRDVYAGIIARLKAQGYQIDRRRETRHGPG